MKLIEYYKNAEKYYKIKFGNVSVSDLEEKELEELMFKIARKLKYQAQVNQTVNRYKPYSNTWEYVITSNNLVKKDENNRTD